MIKKTKIKVAAGLTIIILVIFGIIFPREKAISVSKVKWNCNVKNCNVDFTIHNNSYSTVEIKIGILGYYKVPRNSGGLEDVGKMIFSIKLYPDEKVNIIKSVKFSRRPEYIIVNVLEKDE